jgi:diguanylate cyclase (GGDEF)-like protein/PAS domain S-box-containing protein
MTTERDGERDGDGSPSSEIERLRRELDECRRERSALAESEIGHRRFMENLTGGYFFYRHDRDRVYRYLSPSVRQVLGYTPEEYIARYGSLFTDAEINSRAALHTARAIAGEPQYSFEVEMLAQGGQRLTLEVSEVPVLGADGEVELVEGIAHDVTETKRMQRRLLELATHDELTGLLNRRHLRVRLDEAISLARRHLFPVAMALVDLDGLKRINDAHGHAAGDRLICAAAGILQRELRRGDIIGRLESVAGRLGGDEFAAVLPYSGDQQARIAMQRILDSFDATEVEVASGVRIQLRASIGVAAMWPDESSDSLQARADQALYRAKRAGRGQIAIWNETDA